MISVMIADDQALVRGGFRMILETQDDMVVCGETENGAEAIELAAAETPDVVLMDVRMPIVDGIEATRHIVAAQTSVRVLMLTTFDEERVVYQPRAMLQSALRELGKEGQQVADDGPR